MISAGAIAASSAAFLWGRQVLLPWCPPACWGRDLAEKKIVPRSRHACRDIRYPSARIRPAGAPPGAPHHPRAVFSPQPAHCAGGHSTMAGVSHVPRVDDPRVLYSTVMPIPYSASACRRSGLRRRLGADRRTDCAIPRRPAQTQLLAEWPGNTYSFSLPPSRVTYSLTTLLSCCLLASYSRALCPASLGGSPVHLDGSWPGR